MPVDTTYEGWPNRETWLVHLHLSSDEGLYRAARWLATTCYEDATAEGLPEHLRDSELVTLHSWARRTAAECMAEHVRELVHVPGDHPRTVFVRDLVGQALAVVEWGDVADAFIDMEDEA